MFCFLSFWCIFFFSKIYFVYFVHDFSIILIIILTRCRGVTPVCRRRRWTAVDRSVYVSGRRCQSGQHKSCSDSSLPRICHCSLPHARNTQYYRGGSTICQTGGGGTMASPDRKPITGIRPQRGPAAQPLVRAKGGEAPLKLKAFCPFSYKRGAKS